VAKKLSEVVKKEHAKVLDLCCGVGMSTRALKDAFPDAESVIGVDTSAEMVAMANFMNRHLAFFIPIVEFITKRLSTISLAVKEKGDKINKKVAEVACATAAKYVRANAESTELPDKEFDLITIMYAFHEAPKEGRDKILREARRLLRPGGTLAVVDIATGKKLATTCSRGLNYRERRPHLIVFFLLSFLSFYNAQTIRLRKACCPENRT